MQSQIINEYTKTTPKLKFNQGDILKDISIIAHTDNNENGAVITEIFLDYGVVINQDCDLEHDFNNRNNPQSLNQDKFLPNLLILPAYLANKFREGTHRGKHIKGMYWNNTLWNPIIQNRDIRFHFIKSDEEFQVPDLVVDFKHLYTIDRDVAYSKINGLYLVTICEIYREHLSHRYSHYLSRIGLPDKSS